MGNNTLCYKNGEVNSQFNSILMKHYYQDCEIALTAGHIQEEDVECIVVPTDREYSKVEKRQKPTFIAPVGECIFVAGTKKEKDQILAVVQETQGLVSSNESEEDKQMIFKAVQNALKMASQKQKRSIGFPVMHAKDNTTSATIMFMALKDSITENKESGIKRVTIILEHWEEVNSFKWVFSKVFGINNNSPSRSYSNTVKSQYENNTIDVKQIKQANGIQYAEIP